MKKKKLVLLTTILGLFSSGVVIAHEQVNDNQQTAQLTDTDNDGIVDATDNDDDNDGIPRFN